MTIQVDMFDVQLGAAVLIQFTTATGVVRVLADGGNTKHNIATRLPAVMGAGDDNEADQPLRIDLIVGTHYDADHLDGLVAVINSKRFEIGEVWLPPVANDVDSYGQSGPPTDDQILGLQLLRDDSGAVLERYLNTKADEVSRLAALVSDHDDHDDRALSGQSEKLFAAKTDPEDKRSFFLEHLENARQLLAEMGDGGGATCEDDCTGHADDPVDMPFDQELDAGLNEHEWFWERATPESLVSDWKWDVDRSRAARMLFTRQRKAKSKEAINAASLSKVVDAVKRRKIKARFAIIANGAPRTFVWRPTAKRFVPNGSRIAGEPQLVLLGPSEALVAKYRDQLPTLSYAYMLAKSVDLVGSTPSNELSYVIRFDHDEQRILIAGDAGCVDFMPGRQKPYYQPLLDELTSLDVIQIAHHGGANAHFYRCLLAAGIETQPKPAHLLLSHEVNSSSRPSGAFSQFIELSKRSPDQMPLLFTSKPREVKVRDVLDYFSPTIGAPMDRGDVRMRYTNGWVVERHVVEPPAPV